MTGGGCYPGQDRLRAWHSFPLLVARISREGLGFQKGVQETRGGAVGLVPGEGRGRGESTQETMPPIGPEARGDMLAKPPYPEA